VDWCLFDSCFDIDCSYINEVKKVFMVEQKAPSLNLAQRTHTIEMLLKATQPKGYTDYYNPRLPLVGKELSIGAIDKTDMMANDVMSWTILELFYHAQFDLAFDFMTWYQNDWKASMSIGGELLRNLTSPEYRYTQTQNVHEYQHRPEKRGLLGGRKQPPPEQGYGGP
jgi:hypothetical protein